MGGAAFGSLFKATDFTTLISNSTATVPTGANAIHIQQAVGGGSSGVNGGVYDKSGGESSGAGGGSGAYISDKIFTVSAGETITFTVGAGGSGNTGPNPNFVGVDGGDTIISGSSTGNVAVLTGSVAGGSSGGSSSPNVGPLRTNYAATGGTATLATSVSSGNFIESDGAVNPISNTTASLRGGVIGTFDESGNGVAGENGANCSGDNCIATAGNGGASYNGQVSGGAKGTSSVFPTAGSQGSGGGGGVARFPPNGNYSSGANGGDGEIIYRFIKVL